MARALAPRVLPAVLFAAVWLAPYLWDPPDAPRPPEGAPLPALVVLHAANVEPPPDPKAWDTQGVACGLLALPPSPGPASIPADELEGGEGRWISSVDRPVLRVPVARRSAMPSSRSPTDFEVHLSRHPRHAHRRRLRVVVRPDLFDLVSVASLDVETDPDVVVAWRLLERVHGEHAVVWMELVVRGDPTPAQVATIHLYDERGNRLALADPWPPRGPTSDPVPRGADRETVSSWP